MDLILQYGVIWLVGHCLQVIYVVSTLGEGSIIILAQSVVVWASCDWLAADHVVPQGLITWPWMNYFWTRSKLRTVAVV